MAEPGAFGELGRGTLGLPIFLWSNGVENGAGQLSWRLSETRRHLGTLRPAIWSPQHLPVIGPQRRGLLRTGTEWDRHRHQGEGTGQRGF